MNRRSWSAHLDSAALGAALVLANLHLLGIGLPAATLAMHPAQLPHAWWGIITHPFVHVSGYHLLLDALAFFTLYPSCAPHWRGRLRLLACCALGSLAGALGEPDVATGGFCGLSGIDHGLMAAGAISMCRRARSHADVATGATLLLVVGLKCALEVQQGAPAFASFHLGDIGRPVVASHAGGVLGALALMCGTPGLRHTLCGIRNLYRDSPIRLSTRNAIRNLSDHDHPPSFTARIHRRPDATRARCRLEGRHNQRVLATLCLPGHAVTDRVGHHARDHARDLVVPEARG